MRSWLSLLAIVVGLTMNACAASTDEALDRCRTEQAQGVVEMERAIDTVLSDVPHELDRGDSCGDTGTPRTVVFVSVKTWQKPKVANKHFRQQGWRRDDDWFRSPDGAYAALITTATDSDGSPRYVFIQVREGDQA